MAQSREYVEYANNFPVDPFEEVSWIHKCPQMATPIQDQLSCSCCWAIACATIIGYLIFLHPFNEFGVSLSWQDFSVAAQQLLDRVILYYKEYCNLAELDEMGGYPGSNLLAYTFCRDHGLPQEFRDPYAGRRKYAPFVIGADEYPRFKISSFECLGDWSDDSEQKSKILEALKEQPLVAGIDSTQDFENFNGEGIFEALPGQKFVRHAVVVVAVNTFDGYFIIRNSWSRLWGRGGYAKVKCSQLYLFSRPLPPVKFIRAPPLTSADASSSSRV